MKVCMFVHNNFKHDSRVLKEAGTLAEAGYDVRVIAVLDDATTPYEERDGFRIIRVAKESLCHKALRVTRVILLPFYWISNFMSLSLGRLTHKLTEGRSAPSKINKAIKKLKHAFNSKIKRILKIFYKPLTFLDYAYHSVELVTKEPADIYHAHDLNTLPAAYWAKKKMGGKLVYDSHELYTETSTLSKFEKLASRILERYLIHRVNTVITVNGSIANELLKRYKVRLPIVIMNCPKVGYRKRKPTNSLLRQKLGLDGEIPVILYQGGYAPNRGLQNLIMSAHYLNKVIIVLMGWGKLEQELKDLTEAEGLGERIRFADPASQQNLLYYTASATLGVIPYQFVGLNNYYTSPNKLFEYIAGGLPVIGSNFPELKKVIEEYKLGMTFNPDDPKDIAEAINYVLSDKDRYEQMRRNALKAAKVFNWENESKKLLEIYRRLEDEVNITSN